MEHYLASARKYRPQKFQDVVGQEAITNTLENAIRSSHLAQAFLFCGPRGVGKTTCARILAKVINTAEGESIDPDEDFAFNIFELDAASNNSVDDIRSLTEQVRIPPQLGSYKVYIIDEAHMLSQAAFNAFLKTLEEPPAHAIFILATTEKHKIIPTILSRCQIYDFKRIDIGDIVGHLSRISEEEGISAEADALHLIAEKADGALRDALSIFDQVVSFSGKELNYKQVSENLNVLDFDYYFRIGDAIRKNDIPAALLSFDEILQNGFDGHLFINGLGTHFRNLLVCKQEQTLKLLEVSDSAKTRYSDQAAKIEFDDILLALRVISKCDVQYKTSKNQRLLVEICLMQLCSIVASEKKKSSELR
ncbi:MAG TPA: DNA polymerase III subunit gamma/tau, partial [Flavobacteriales bacterium]|nr:DNA polymerase III subunit gamma/tau [Flavobacteriales bacterium]